MNFVCFGFRLVNKQWGKYDFNEIDALNDQQIIYPMSFNDTPKVLIPFLKFSYPYRSFAGTPFYISNEYKNLFKFGVSTNITSPGVFYWISIGS